MLRALGDVAAARAGFERALAIDEAAYGPNHPTVARDVNNLAGVLRDLGNLAGFERALAIDEAVYGPNHPTVATMANNLAGVLRDLGQNGEVVERYAVGTDSSLKVDPTP